MRTVNFNIVSFAAICYQKTNNTKWGLYISKALVCFALTAQLS